MPKRNFPTGLLIVCITLLVALALVRDDLCEVQYQDGTQLFKAVLAYEVRESSLKWWGVNASPLQVLFGYIANEHPLFSCLISLYHPSYCRSATS